MKFVDNAETLMFVATSHYEPDESAYDRLLVRIRTLDREHRNRVALVHGAILASHLRFGFEASYKRDIADMRSDNAADYPWLCFALATLMSDYVGMRDDGIEGTERYRVVEGIVNALTPGRSGVRRHRARIARRACGRTCPTPRAPAQVQFRSV